ncbi:hypothetical protein [Paenibacillus sp. 2KB_22]|uniref:hypothetical protein n=1 Tax=Paenibacillus sp. 2KB_22 TaxID=3232978 RepID=UPI003F9D4050
MVMGNVLIFIWKELNSYDVSVSNVSERIGDANKAFHNIFRSIKVNTIVGLMIYLAFIIILNIYKRDQVMIWFTYFMAFVIGLILVLIFIVLKRNKEKFFIMDHIKKVFTLNSALRFSAYVVLFIIWLVLGLGIMTPKHSVQVNIHDDRLVITSTNALPEEVLIEFLQPTEKEEILSHSITLDKNSFLESYQRVVYYPDKEADIFYSLRNVSKENEMVYQLDQTEQLYSYEYDFSQYMMDGNNEIRITIKSNDSGDKLTVISTPVIHEKGENKVLKNEFLIR